MGGDAAGEAMAQSAAGEIDRIAMIGASGSETPEKMKGRKLFIVAREDRGSGDILRLPKIQESFKRSPEPKKLVILDGSAHAQFLFGTNQEERLMNELLQFLSGP